MGNHLLDGEEKSQNFENFQEYPSFDNGILDLEPMSSEIMNAEPVDPVTMSVETMNNGILDLEPVNPGIMNMEPVNPGIVDTEPVNPGIMNPEAVNPGIMNPVIKSVETMNNGILDIGAMDSGSMNAETINSGIGNPATINSGTVNPGIMNSETMNPGVVNPESMDSEIMNVGAINSETMNSEIPVQQTFDPGMPDTSNNFEQAIAAGTIDSRSFTHTEAEWQKIQEGAATVDYVDSTASWDNYRERKPQNFFTVFLAFFVSIIVAVVFVVINVMLYDIEYVSTAQILLSMLPAIALFTCFYYMTGRRAMAVAEGLLLIVLNEILSYIMFHAVMAHNVQKIYPEFSFMEAWSFVNIMKAITETQRIYYLHFVIIFGIASVLGIAYGILGIKGLLDEVGVRRRRYW